MLSSLSRRGEEGSVLGPSLFTDNGVNGGGGGKDIEDIMEAASAKRPARLGPSREGAREACFAKGTVGSWGEDRGGNGTPVRHQLPARLYWGPINTFEAIAEVLRT